MADGGRVAGPKCVALTGPFASGKTTLLEAILARTGALSRQGTIAEKNTLGDSSPEARAHQMTVEVNIAETEFMGDRLTFLDCPGSVEFAFEAEAILPAVDLAVVVAEADEKKIPALQVILRTLEEKKVPRLLFLNKVDKADASVRSTLQMLQPASGVPLVLRHIPIWQSSVITGFIDLALERAFVYREHAPSEPARPRPVSPCSRPSPITTTASWSSCSRTSSPTASGCSRTWSRRCAPA
jgi:elongation factor G